SDENLPSEASRWLTFIFSPQLYLEGKGKLQGLYESQIAFSKELIARPHQRPDTFELRTVSSDQEGNDVFKTGARDVYDTWYFDDSTWQTLISCMRKSKNRNPNNITCVHYFVVPEREAVAHERYMVMADVAD